MRRVRHEVPAHASQPDSFRDVPQEQQFLVRPVRHHPAIEPAFLPDRRRDLDLVRVRVRAEQFREFRIAKYVVHALAAVFLAFQPAEVLGGLVAHDDLVVLIEDHGAVRHCIRRTPDLLEQPSILFFRAHRALVLVVVARKQLLPDAFAVAEFFEIAGMHGAVEAEQLPGLPGQDRKCRDQEPPLGVTVNPADQAARRQDGDEPHDEFSG